jgi:hypothetical protein
MPARVRTQRYFTGSHEFAMNESIPKILEIVLNGQDARQTVQHDTRNTRSKTPNGIQYKYNSRTGSTTARTADMKHRKSKPMHDGEPNVIARASITTLACNNT